MNKTTRNILFAVGGLFIGIYLYGKFSKKLRKPSEEQLSTLNMDLVLEKGSKGSEVVELQRILKDELGYDLGTFGENADGIDGNFGSITENALFKAKAVKKITLREMYSSKK